MTTQPDAGGIAVIKIGGSTLGANDTSLRDIAVARREGRQLVVVHGGGAAVTAWLDALNIRAVFERGLRVTDARTLDVVVAVLGGLVNKQLVGELCAFGAPAVGLSGADAMILQARIADPALGLVGEITRVNPFPVEELVRLGYLPVIAPIAIDVRDGVSAQLLNTNADTAAGEIAAALHAAQLVLLTDVPGVLDERKVLVPRLAVDEARLMIDSGAASGGMIPKLRAAVRAVETGCEARIIDGTVAGALSGVLSGQGGGTTIR